MLLHPDTTTCTILGDQRVWCPPPISFGALAPLVAEASVIGPLPTQTSEQIEPVHASQEPAVVHEGDSCATLGSGVQPMTRVFFNGIGLNGCVNPNETVTLGAADQTAILTGEGPSQIAHQDDATQVKDGPAQTVEPTRPVHGLIAEKQIAGFPVPQLQHCVAILEVPFAKLEHRFVHAPVPVQTFEQTGHVHVSHELAEQEGDTCATVGSGGGPH